MEAEKKPLHGGISESLNSSDIPGDLADGLHSLVLCLCKESVLTSLLISRNATQSQTQWELLQ